MVGLGIRQQMYHHQQMENHPSALVYSSLQEPAIMEEVVEEFAYACIDCDCYLEDKMGNWVSEGR